MYNESLRTGAELYPLRIKKKKKNEMLCGNSSIAQSGAIQLWGDPSLHILRHTKYFSPSSVTPNTPGLRCQDMSYC